VNPNTAAQVRKEMKDLRDDVGLLLDAQTKTTFDGVKELLTKLSEHMDDELGKVKDDQHELEDVILQRALLYRGFWGRLKWLVVGK
jgi:hypothetical protein